MTKTQPQTSGDDAAQWVAGDTHGINQELLTKLAQVGEKIGQKVTIDSGFRSRDKGNLAAPPGQSNHARAMPLM